MTSKMKYCIDCRYMLQVKRTRCIRPRAQIEHPVYGMVNGSDYSCEDERMRDELCGPEAKFFSPRPEPGI